MCGHIRHVISKPHWHESWGIKTGDIILHEIVVALLVAVEVRVRVGAAFLPSVILIIDILHNHNCISSSSWSTLGYYCK